MPTSGEFVDVAGSRHLGINRSHALFLKHTKKQQTNGVLTRASIISFQCTMQPYSFSTWWVQKLPPGKGRALFFYTGTVPPPVDLPSFPLVVVRVLVTKWVTILRLHIGAFDHMDVQ